MDGLCAALFDHHILKDPGTTSPIGICRRETGTARYTVNGKPLTFFHFSGFDGAVPDLLSKHQGDRPRILLSERPAVAQICREYLASLEAAGLSSRVGVRYGWDRLPSGLLFDRHMRQSYREALDAWEAGKGPEPPNPFDPRGEERFVEWLNEPVGGGLQPFISRYLLRSTTPVRTFSGRAGTRQRPGLALPRVGHERWGLAARHPQVAAAVAVHANRRHAHDVRSGLGADAGCQRRRLFRAELGVGEAARLLTSAIEAAESVRTRRLHTTPRPAARSTHFSTAAPDGAARRQHPVRQRRPDRRVRERRRAALLEGRYTIGFWFWELERFPTTMHQAFDHVDEVWAATRFVAGGIREIGRRPVHTLPLPVPIPRCLPT